MADPQEAASSSDVASSSSQFQENSACSPPYWCYQCRKEVSVEAHEDCPSAMICSECRNGFVEPIGSERSGEAPPRSSLNISSNSNNGGGDSNQNPGNGNGLRRRRQRGNPLAAVATSRAQAQTVTLSDAFGHQQLVHVLQLLGQAARGANHENSGGGNGNVRENGNQNERENAEADRIYPPARSSDVERSVTQEDGDDGRDGESGSDVEAGILERWESDDDEDEEDDDEEEEWEEVVDDDDDAQGGGEENADDDEARDDQEQEQRQSQQSEDILPRRNARVRSHVARRPRHLHHYLQELLQNLVGQNIEVRVEVPQYVGNPGDYVDARGFELLLQQLAENDNSRRGAPPAAKSAVTTLPTILIEQAHLDDGSAVCAVCKDAVCLGAPATQMPCLHLYHTECILPWLASRNSCPVCRFELPTDDPDYEDQKLQNNQQRSCDQSTSSRAVERVESQQQTEEQFDLQESAEREAVSSSSSGNLAHPRDAASSSSSRIEDEIQPEEDASDDLLDPAATAAAEQPRSGSRGIRARSSGNSRRSWFLLTAGPMLSMVGIVLVICLGNHFIGGGGGRSHGSSQQQQDGSGSNNHVQRQEPCLDRAASSSDAIQARRRWWWLPFRHR